MSGIGKLGIHTGFDREEKNGVVYFSVPAFKQAGGVRHGFTSRIGGVSPPPFDSLNMSFKREGNRENLILNYQRAAEAIGVSYEKLVACRYTHGNNVEYVDARHHGMGIWRENGLPLCDGVIVTDRDTSAATFHADCCPIFFMDVNHRAAGVCHAGWKGTAGGVVFAILKKLSRLGISGEELLLGIGPTISGECYEVKEDVAGLFEKDFPGAILRREGKLFLDISHVIVKQLLNAGVPEKNITHSGLCTYSRPELFYSYRRDGKSAGAMGAFIQMI